MRVIKTLAHGQINEANKSVDLLRSTLHYLAQQQIKLATNQVESLMRETLIQNPRNVMAKGYGIVRSEGKLFALFNKSQVITSRSNYWMVPFKQM